MRCASKISFRPEKQIRSTLALQYISDDAPNECYIIWLDYFKINLLHHSAYYSQ